MEAVILGYSPFEKSFKTKNPASPKVVSLISPDGMPVGISRKKLRFSSP